MDRYQRVEKAREETPISKNEIRVTAQGRMRNYISYALTLLQETGSNEIVLKAMGRAINKTVMIVELIKRRIVGLHQITKTESIDITDVWEPLEEGLLPLETTRHVSMISITLSKIELDISDPGYQQPIPAEEVRALTDFETDEPNQFVDSVPRGRGRRGGYRGGRGGYRGGRMNNDEIGQGYEGNYAEEGGRGGYRGRRGGFRGGRMNNDEIGQGYDGNYTDEGGRGGYRGGRGGFRGGRMNNDEIGQGYDGNYADEGGRGGYGYNRRGGYRGGRGRGPYRGGRGGRGNYYQNNDHYAVRDDVRDDDGGEQDVLPPPRTERGGRGRGMGRGRGRGHLPPQTEI